jgi:hypothetical protein
MEKKDHYCTLQTGKTIIAFWGAIALTHDLSLTSGYDTIVEDRDDAVAHKAGRQRSL